MKDPQQLKIEHKIKTAKLYEAEGKSLHAIQLYRSIIEDNPENIEAYLELASLYGITGKPDSAISLLNDFLENNPENKEIRLFLGHFLMENSKWNEAVDILSYILPEENPNIAFFIGYCYFQIKEFEIAKHNFLTFISLDKETELLFEASIYLAKIYIQLKDFEEALKHAKKAEVMYANYWELNLLFALIYYNLGMHAHAVGPIEKAIKLKPDDHSVYFWGGKIYFKLGEYIKAEKYFLKSIEMKENVSSELYTDLAEAYLKTKKPKDALMYFELALKLDPKNQYAIKGMTLASSLIKEQNVQ